MKKTGVVISIIVVSFLFFGYTFPVLGASVVVAPFNASEIIKAKADFICDGKNDEVELLESIKNACQWTSASLRETLTPRISRLPSGLMSMSVKTVQERSSSPKQAKCPCVSGLLTSTRTHTVNTKL